MKIALILILLCAFYTQTQCANILAIFPFPGKSHFVMFEKLLLELANRGHDVDIFTHYPRKNPPNNYHQFSFEGGLPIPVNSVPIDMYQGLSNIEMTKFVAVNMGTENCEFLFNHPEIISLKKSKKHYDLVITEIFGSDCVLGFAHFFKAASISLISSFPLPWATDRIGNPDNPSYIPNYYIDCEAEMGLWSRLKNTVDVIIYKALYNYWSTKESEILARNFFGEDLPTLEDLALNTSLILVNSHFSMNTARPTVPNFVEVGGLHINEPRPLPKDLEDFMTLDNNKTSYKGVIYLTMGSMIMTETIPIDRLQGMFDAFAQLPYKVLWKAQIDKFPKGLNFPKNIRFEKWMPQMDVLCHPNVKMFVSHGGLMGSQEAIYCGVPRLGIPLFADQEINIRLSELKGMTVRVDYNEISKETILEAAKKLLEDPKYKENAEKASILFRDRPLSALDTAIYWVEYVIRHKGAPDLASAGRKLPWYQYHLLDVGFILISLALIFIYLLTSLIKFAIRLIFCRAFKTKVD